MSIVIDSPAWAWADVGRDKLARLAEAVSYKDTQVEFELNRMRRNKSRMVGWMGQEQYDAKVAVLQYERIKCLLVERNGRQVFPAGLAREMGTMLDEPVIDAVVAPVAKAVPWHRKLDFEFRPYQVEGVDKLIAARHGCLSLPTGTGKSKLAMKAVRDLGLRAVVASPFSAIVEQTYDEFRHYLGPARVGQYGDGKHDLDKLVTVATAQALQRIEPNTELGNTLSQTQVLIADEAHMWAADTLSHVSQELLGNAPYRFFLTGTHLRGDGRQVMLEGLTGDVLMHMEVSEAVAKGYLTPPKFRMLTMESCVIAPGDPAEATRKCLYLAPRVVSTVADMVNRLARSGRPTLVLIDELEQFTALLPHLQHEVGFAYGGVRGNAKRRGEIMAKIPEKHRKSNPLALVREFNQGKFPILIGTSCITIGADIKAASAGFYWRGGKSEVDVRQGVGRFLRLVPGKTDALIFDIDPTDGGIAHKHARVRAEVYKQIYHDYEEIPWPAAA